VFPFSGFLSGNCVDALKLIESNSIAEKNFQTSFPLLFFFDDALKILRVWLKFNSIKSITDVENVGYLEVV
jgi:hypothetical protein